RELVALELAYRCRRGETPDAAAYRARFPDLNPAWIEREIQAGSAEAREAPAAVAPERIPRTQAQQIRCPHCHNPIQLVDDHPDEVLCPGCGSSFRVRDARHTATVTPSGANLPQLPGYEVLGELGRGGMGVVFKARHT